MAKGFMAGGNGRQRTRKKDTPKSPSYRDPKPGSQRPANGS